MGACIQRGQLSRYIQVLAYQRLLTYCSTGNEADYVLISVVRSSKPGFLTSINRMNVMLTRCRSGLVVVTSSSFLRGGGERTLLGKLARHWEGARGLDKTWIDWRLVAEGVADLPGSPGPKRKSQQQQQQHTRIRPFSQNFYEPVTGRYPLSTLLPTSFDGSPRFPQVAPPLVPRPWHEANFAVADGTNVSWAQIAASLPTVTLSPRTPYNLSSTTSSGFMMFPASEPFPDFPRNPYYGCHGERRRSDYDSQFPSLNGTRSAWNLPSAPQPPARPQYVAKKVSPKAKTPMPVATVVPTTPPPTPTPPTSPETVEWISPRVIRIVSRNQFVDGTTKAQKVAENPRKGNMNQKAYSK